MPICFVNYIFGITSVIKKEYNPTKITNIIKLALIPWYALNFIICLLFIGAMANPWLFMATPIVAAIQVCTTLIFMTSTSIYDISFMISKMIKKEISCNVLNVFLIIFLLIFGLDVISSIIIYCKFKDK